MLQLYQSSGYLSSVLRFNYERVLVDAMPSMLVSLVRTSCHLCETSKSILDVSKQMPSYNVMRNEMTGQILDRPSTAKPAVMSCSRSPLGSTDTQQLQHQGQQRIRPPTCKMDPALWMGDTNHDVSSHDLPVLLWSMLNSRI